MAELNNAADPELIDDDDELASSDSIANAVTEPLTFTVGAGQGDRLDKFLMAVLPVGSVSREKLKVAIRDGLCNLDGAVCQEPKTKVFTGQTVSIAFVAEASGIVPSPLSLNYLYTDASLVVVQKPFGLTVHPCPSCDEVTLVQGVAADFPQLAAMTGLRPGIVHRLDKDTSGLMLVALREDVRLRLSEAFAEREVHKTYLAVVCGVPVKHGECKELIGRHPTQRVKMAVTKRGRQAHTEWERLYADPEGRFSLLAVTIHTGRTHQIRVHMTHVGHPLVGDSLYTLPKWKAVQALAVRQMLHAWKLEFVHPASGETMNFVCPMPDDMRQTLLRLNRSTLRVVITGCPGCGKSTVLKYLGEQGLPVFSADAAVAESYAAGQEGQKLLARHLGGSFMNPATGEVDRRKLFAHMQTDDALRQKVNTLIHPLVFARLCQFWDDAEAAGYPLAVAEIPLWSESRQGVPQERATVLVGVACDTSVRHERLSANRGWSPEMCQQMDAWQLPESEKFAKADIIVNNNGSYETLVAALPTVKQRLESAYARANKALLEVINTVV